MGVSKKHQNQAGLVDLTGRPHKTFSRFRKTSKPSGPRGSCRSPPQNILTFPKSIKTKRASWILPVAPTKHSHVSEKHQNQAGLVDLAGRPHKTFSRFQKKSKPSGPRGSYRSPPQNILTFPKKHQNQAG